MSKQDRQGARTVTDLEQKYDFGKSISEQSAVNAEHSKKIEALEYHALNNQFTAVKRFEEIEARLDAVEENTVSGDRIAALEAANASQNESITALTARVATLETTVTGLSTRITTAETTLASLEARVAALENGEVVT